jgi:mannose-1-phosphate guanylyltransferase
MLHTLILAGGSGTRLWPLSRAGQPKFLHPLTGTDRSLLQATVDRLGPLAAAEQTWVVTGASHLAAVTEQLPTLLAANILVEPSPRDSCAAIALAATVIAERDPKAIIGVFAADHLIADEDRFVEVVRKAVGVASGGYLTTVGILPTRPETGYGYLRLGDPLGGGANLVAEFKEKPSHQLATTYVASGAYLWNGGMFVFQAGTFLHELARQKPDISAGIARIAAAWDTADREAVLRDIWPTLEKISVDYAVMEGAAAEGSVATVPADFGWSDVGDFHSLGDSLDCDDAGNLVLGDDTITMARDVKNTVIVSGSGRVVAAIGVEDLVIVETADAVLVSVRSRAHEVKDLVNELSARGGTNLI